MRRNSLGGWGGLAMIGWLGAAITAVQQKTAVDSTIGKSFEISAVQIQQLNGSLTAHILVAIVVAATLTIPFLLYVGSEIVKAVAASSAPEPPAVAHESGTL